MTAKTAAARHLLGQVPLRDYFKSDESMGATLAAVQFKVVACFLRATHPQTGRTTGKDNCICGLGPELGAVVAYAASRINIRREFGHGHLPKSEADLTRAQWAQVMFRIHRELITLAVVHMRDTHKLYFMDGDWCFSNELRTEHDHMAQMSRKKENDYRGDRRNFHGRPGDQGRRRAKGLRLAPGVSIGAS
jgi:hypothetical protein